MPESIHCIQNVYTFVIVCVCVCVAIAKAQHKSMLMECRNINYAIRPIATNLWGNAEHCDEYVALVKLWCLYCVQTKRHILNYSENVLRFITSEQRATTNNKQLFLLSANKVYIYIYVLGSLLVPNQLTNAQNLCGCFIYYK